MNIQSYLLLSLILIVALLSLFRYHRQKKRRKACGAHSCDQCPYSCKKN